MYRVLTSRGGCVYRGRDRDEAARRFGKAIEEAEETGEASVVLMADSTVIERWERSRPKRTWFDLPGWIESLLLRLGRTLHLLNIEEEKD